jgi:tRNA(Ile)-lysidine synthase
VIIDRKKLILSEIAPGEIENVKIDQEQPSVNLPDGRLDIKLFAGMPESFPLTLDIEYVAAAKLTFPLTIRRWQAGDFFFPIGMHGKKQKVKKYFTNEKVSLFEKESQWVLTSDDDIVWLVGRRLDHRFRIGKKTSYYYRIRWTPNY